ncbi:MAG: choice-of-anchor Q domain-containing protein, partial [Planctomycetota bacterium]
IFAGGILTLTDGTVSGNSTSGVNADGGGIFSNSGHVTLTSSTVSGNSSGRDGGGIFAVEGTINNSTITNNSASGAGGGIGLDADGDESLIILNSIIADNTAIITSPDFFAPLNAGDLTVEFSLIGDNTGTGLTVAPVGSPDANGNLIGGSINTIDPLLAPLADNGGPTMTHALLTGSPALNAGDPNFDISSAPFDQRGTGFTRVNLGRIDIGAFEFSPTGDILVQQQAADPSQLEVLVDGVSLFAQSLVTATDLSFISQPDNDQSLTIDFTNGFFETPNGISFTGNAGDNDQLLVVGSTSPQFTRAALTSETSPGSGVLQLSEGSSGSPLTFANVATVALDNLLSFRGDEFVVIDSGQTLNIDALGFSTFEGTTVLSDGGTINAPNGVSFGSGDALQGAGSLNTRIDADGGSTITATGNLTLGDATSVIGFSSDGVLNVGSGTVTINDANEAVFGSLTTLAGGQLVAGTATPDVGTDNADLPEDFLLEDGKNVTGRGSIAGNFRNMGSVIGDGTVSSERIIFEDGFTVTGIGSFARAQFDGVFAPGLSPGIVTGTNLALAGNVQIELGGTTPGTGDNFHDQIHDTDELIILDTATLVILPWNNFQPTVGDEFDILVADAALTGSFGSVSVHPDFVAAGIDFDLQYSAGSLKLVAVSTDVGCDLDGDSDCDIDDIDALVQEIATGTHNGAFDLTGDGNVDLADRDQWLADAGAENLASGNPYPLGDANLDGTVDVSDFNIWNTNKFSQTAAWSDADFNADGSVDVSDFNVWNTYKFQSADSGSSMQRSGRSADDSSDSIEES